MTVCSYSCERKTNGFLIEDFDSIERTNNGVSDPELREAIDDLMKPRAGAL